MKEIREIFETVRTYCGMMFGDAKRPRGEEDKSVTGKMYCHALLSEGEKVSVRAERVTDTREGLSQISSLQNTPLSRISNAHNSSQRTATSSLGEVNVTTSDNNLIQLQGKKNNSSETDHASMPLGIFTSKNLAAWLPSCLAAKHAAFTLAEGATHVAHCDKFRRAAFTLAEVLITLGIIGVVAALTLPTLIQNHQKQVYVTQLKKAYSTLGNAFNKMAADEGVVDWNQTYCSSSFWVENNLEAAKANYNECLDRIAKQMKVIKYKHYGEQCNEAWCEFSSDPIDYNPTGGNPIMVTADGITYLFNCGSAYDYIVVDVNGTTKGPNKPGRDIFQFTAYKNKYDSSGHWSGSEFKNALYPDGSEHDYWKDCSATNLSTGCTAKVLIEGKMNY